MKKRTKSKPTKQAGYYVHTIDPDGDCFTPQIGVPEGPYTLMGLRKALRALQSMGYEASRFPRQRILETKDYHPKLRSFYDGSDPSVLVWKCEEDSPLFNR